MTDGKLTTGVVAKIVSDREVILNRGEEHKLSVGDYVAVIDTKTQSIIDPETGENLGGLKRIKAVLRIVEVTQKLALAKTFRTRTIKIGGGLGSAAFPNIFAEPKFETRVETLEIDPKAGMPLDEQHSAIAVGDPFEVMDEEEAEDTRTATLWR